MNFANRSSGCVQQNDAASLHHTNPDMKHFFLGVTAQFPSQLPCLLFVFFLSLLRQMPRNHPMRRTSCPTWPWHSTTERGTEQAALMRGRHRLTRHRIVTEGKAERDFVLPFLHGMLCN